VRLVGHRAVARDDDGLVVDAGENLAATGDHAVDPAAGGHIDVGINALEVEVARLHDVGVAIIDDRVAVGVGRSGGRMHELHLFIAGAQREFAIKVNRRKRQLGLVIGERRETGGNGQAFPGDHTRAHFLLRDNDNTGGAERLVAVGVVEMPVRVHQHADGLRRELGDGGLERGRGLGILAGVDEDHRLVAHDGRGVGHGVAEGINPVGELHGLDGFRGIDGQRAQRRESQHG